MSRIAVVAALVSALFVPVVGTAPSALAAAGITDDVSAVPVATNLSGVVDVDAPLGDERLFIVQNNGRISILEDGALLAAPFLDIAPKVDHRVTSKVFLVWPLRPIT